MLLPVQAFAIRKNRSCWAILITPWGGWFFFPEKKVKYQSIILNLLQGQRQEQGSQSPARDKAWAATGEGMHKGKAAGVSLPKG